MKFDASFFGPGCWSFSTIWMPSFQMVNWPFSIGVDMKLSDLGGTIFPPNDIVLYLALLSNDDISCLSTLCLYFFILLFFFLSLSKFSCISLLDLLSLKLWELYLLNFWMLVTCYVIFGCKMNLWLSIGHSLSLCSYSFLSLWFLICIKWFLGHFALAKRGCIILYIDFEIVPFFFQL